MEILRQLGARFLRRIARWSRSEGREILVEARSAGPCPVCGHERLRIREARVDDLGFGVRIRDLWCCGCGEHPVRPGAGADPPDPSRPPV